MLPNVLVLCCMMSFAQVSGHKSPPCSSNTGSGTVCDMCSSMGAGNSRAETHREQDYWHRERELRGLARSHNHCSWAG